MYTLWIIHHWQMALFIATCCLCPANQRKWKNYEASFHFILLCQAPKFDWKSLTCKWLKRHVSNIKGLVFYLAAKSNHFEIFVDNTIQIFFIRSNKVRLHRKYDGRFIMKLKHVSANPTKSDQMIQIVKDDWQWAAKQSRMYTLWRIHVGRMGEV